MNRRLELVKYSVTKKNIGGSTKAWLLNCFGPTCGMLAKRCIEEMEETDEYMRIKLRDHNGSLFFSKSISLLSVYQTIAEQLYDWQWHYYQIPQTTVNHTDIVLDCGSAEGIFCYLNHKSAKYIYAFEPLPEYLNGLTKTFKDVANVEIINSALGDKCGTAYLKSQGIASSITPEKTETEVRIISVDNFCENNDIEVSYLKADLEGYELNLLKGASRTIKKNKPKIAITTYHHESHASEIEHFLLSVNSNYNILTKGIEAHHGAPVMLHAW